MTLKIDESLVRRLLAEQFPQWSELSLRPIPSNGTDNMMYRLGRDRCVRLPYIERAVPHIAKEQEWLPRLATHLPLRVPKLLGRGRPGSGYPWMWSVYDWIEGEEATIERLADPRAAAIELGTFISALQRIDATGAPLSGPPTGDRGVPLLRRERATRDAFRAMAELPELEGVIDLRRLERIWDDALRAPAWNGPPRWAHFDLHAGNLLALEGRLNAVIDWGMAGAGDPAAELHVAWGWVPVEDRDAFRAAVGIDDATWARGLGWALSVAVIQVAYYLPRGTHPVLVRRAVEGLADLPRKLD